MLQFMNCPYMKNPYMQKIERKMPAKKPSSGKKIMDFGEIPSVSQVPADIAPEAVEFLKGLIDSFNQSAEGLQVAYKTLQEKFDKLNLQLEEANRDLKKSFDEQERLSNYLTNILESLSSGVLVVDKEGLITLFNRGAEIITGINLDEAIGKNYHEVMGSDTPEELTPFWVLSTGEGRSQMEKTVVSKNGDNIPVGFSISPLLSSAGKLLGAVEIFMDMSRIKALEDEISRMDKLAALGQMSATMAHKIRNPLGGVVGYAGLIDNTLDSKDKSKKHIRKIIKGVEKINHIIESVLAYNTELKLKPREVDLTERIDELIACVKQEMDEDKSLRIGFSIIEPADPLSVEADADQLNSALLNIFRNSIEAIEGDGNIDVRIIPGKSQMNSSCPLTSELINKMRSSSRLLKSKRPCCIITITDSGIGMDGDTVKNLFVPFFTTKEKGIGLGLASAGKIIDAHHGEIWVESTLNYGTAVGIILPIKSTVL